jgi:hypothetical protein
MSNEKMSQSAKAKASQPTEENPVQAESVEETIAEAQSEKEEEKLQTDISADLAQDLLAALAREFEAEDRFQDVQILVTRLLDGCSSGQLTDTIASDAILAQVCEQHPIIKAMAEELAARKKRRMVQQSATGHRWEWSLCPNGTLQPPPNYPYGQQIRQLPDGELPLSLTAAIPVSALPSGSSPPN